MAEPRLGDYLYDLSGSSQSPLTGLTRPYPQGSTATTQIRSSMPVEGGTQYEMTTSSPQDNSTATSRVRWEQQRVLLLFSSLTLPGLARYDCTYIPPVEVLHLPLAVGALPRQSWSSDECSGTLDTSVLGVEEVQAAGRRWRAWKIQSRGTYRIGGAVDGTVEAVNWFAPELGVAVKAEVTNDATLTGRPFKSRQITLLRSHP